METVILGRVGLYFEPEKEITLHWKPGVWVFESEYRCDGRWYSIYRRKS